jgi:hypothetical protein
MKKTILHITAGDDNWTPTTRELNALTQKFKRAILKASPTDTPVVATRSAVKAQVVEFDPVPFVTSGYITPVVSNQSNPLMTPGFPTYTMTTTQDSAMLNSQGNQQ